jgi:uncharacterized protein YoxC
MTAEDIYLALAVAAAVALGIITLAALVATVALVRASRAVRRTAAAAQNALDTINTDLPATLRDLRATSAQLARLSSEVPPRLERIDGLLDEADASVQSLRATAEAAEDIVRGPAAAIDRARRTVNAAGKGLARGADRLRRSVEERRTRS